MSSPKSKARRVRVKRNPGIYLSSSGKYEIAFRDSDGRLRFKTVEGSLEDAKDALAQVRARKSRGERIAPSKTTLAEYADGWFETLTVRPSTQRVYRQSFDRYVRPRLGAKPLASLTVDDVARLIADMTRAGYSGHTINGALTPLSKLYRHAERAGLVSSSPVRKLDKSERPKLPGERRSLDSQDVRRLLAAAGKPFRPLVAVGAFAGLRIGEALGLRWEDIDFEHGVIHVRRTIERNGLRTAGELKTARSRRSVVLVPELARVLREQKLASLYSQPGDYVFCLAGGKPRCPHATAAAILRAARRAGLEGVTFHTLRHAFASMLISGLKLDVETVSRQLGHANSAITLKVYSHEFDAARNLDAVRDALSERFGHLLVAEA